MNKELLNNLYTIQDGLGNIYLANFVKTDKGVDWIAYYRVHDYDTNFETHQPFNLLNSGYGGLKVLQNHITRLRCPKVKNGRRGGCNLKKLR